jgi:hypothetical protein
MYAFRRCSNGNVLGRVNCVVWMMMSIIVGFRKVLIVVCSTYVGCPF